MPKWNERSGCCWRRTCTPEQVSWREYPLTAPPAEEVRPTPGVTRLLSRRQRSCSRELILPEVRDVGLAATWRTERLGHWGVIKRIVDQGHAVSLLLELPWVRTHVFRIDWLRAVDQGVAADFLANTFLLALPKLPGGSVAARVSSLWAKTQDYYTRHAITDRFRTWCTQ